MFEEITDIWLKKTRPYKFNTCEAFFEHGFQLTEDDRFTYFQLDKSPWIRAACQWFDDHETDWIYLVQGSQTAKTTFLMGCFLFVSQYVPGAVPCLWVQSTEDEAKQFISDRFMPFLDQGGQEVFKKKRWKTESFRFFNAPVKVGYATALQTLRTKPCRFVFGDECGIWRISIAYVKKRTRTFAGKRKGIFGTTPPFNGNHFSWQDATAANFYQWWVPCPACNEYQGLRFSQLKWEGRRDDGSWDMDIVIKTTRYQCAYCDAKWEESQKLEIINKGKIQCVSPDSYTPAEPKTNDSKTLQVSSLYSVFTPWSALAIDFLKAKRSGVEALKIFYTDELAEAPKDFGESFKDTDFASYIDLTRQSGQYLECEFITVGIDVQRKGELYFCVVGWRSGVLPSAHIIKYGVVLWKDKQGNISWDALVRLIGEYGQKVWAACIDSSDGVVTHDVYSFVNWAGNPYMAIKDKPNYKEAVSFSAVEIDPRTKNRMAFGQKIMNVNSFLIKDEIAAAFKRRPGDPGAWTFPADTSEIFLTHLTNEHRITEKRGIREVITWKPKYAGAPQHWFSALVYAVAGMQEFKLFLQERKEESPTKVAKKQNTWINIDSWSIQNG